jgi:hypothetical protein
MAGMTYERITQRIALMTDSLSGTAERRWFEHDADARVLHRVSRHQATLERRALDTVRWILTILNIPSHATRVIPLVVAQEFTILVENHKAVWDDLTTWAEEQRAVCQTAGEREELEAKLRHPQRQIAYSHEVMYKCGDLAETARFDVSPVPRRRQHL